MALESSQNDTYSALADGKTDQCLSPQNNEWFLTLSRQAKIYEIQIIKSDRDISSNFFISVGMSNGKPFICITDVNMLGSTNKRFRCTSPVVGQSIGIQSHGNDIFDVCEVRIFGIYLANDQVTRY